MQTVLQWRQKRTIWSWDMCQNHQDKVLEICRSPDRVKAVKLVLSDNDCMERY